MKHIIMHNPTKPLRLGFLALCCMLLLTACGYNMRDQSRIKPYEPNTTFPNNQSEQPIDPNTVARSQSTNLRLVTGKGEDGAVLNAFPLTVEREVIVRGQKEYGIYCVPCHGAAADGKGVVSGYFNPKPADLHADAMRAAPVGHFYDVITNGKGIMFSYASRISPEDRWAIIAYIRALQINAEAPLDVSLDQIQQTGAAVGGAQ